MKKSLKFNKSVLTKCVFKCLENSKELFEEAEILEKNMRFPRAYTLYHLSIEEIGKVFLIFKYLIKDDYCEETLKKFEDQFRDHKLKIELSRKIEKIMITLLQSELKEDEFNKLTYSKEIIEKLNNYKNLSLYASIDNDFSFKPSEIIGINEVNAVKENAKLRLISSERFFTLAIKDIDELIRHYKNII